MSAKVICLNEQRQHNDVSSAAAAAAAIVVKESSLGNSNSDSNSDSSRDSNSSSNSNSDSDGDSNVVAASSAAPPVVEGREDITYVSWSQLWEDILQCTEGYSFLKVLVPEDQEKFVFQLTDEERLDIYRTRAIRYGAWNRILSSIKRTARYFVNRMCFEKELPRLGKHYTCYYVFETDLKEPDFDAMSFWERITYKPDYTYVNVVFLIDDGRMEMLYSRHIIPATMKPYRKEEIRDDEVYY